MATPQDDHQAADGSWTLTLVSDDEGLVRSVQALLLKAPEASLAVTGSADVLTGLRNLAGDVVLIDADSVPDVSRLVGAAVLIQPAPVAVTGLHVTADARSLDLCRSRGASLVFAKPCGTAGLALAGPAGDALLANLRTLATDRQHPPLAEAPHGRV